VAVTLSVFLPILLLLTLQVFSVRSSWKRIALWNPCAERRINACVELNYAKTRWSSWFREMDGFIKAPYFIVRIRVFGNASDNDDARCDDSLRAWYTAGDLHSNDGRDRLSLNDVILNWNSGTNHFHSQSEIGCFFVSETIGSIQQHSLSGKIADYGLRKRYRKKRSEYDK